ncbi:hypothetical protein LTR65_010796 [Meristemomyces frigidus]
MDFVKSTFHDCKMAYGRHETSVPVSGTDKPLLPHYSIEIIAPHKVRLHECQGSRASYLTLSHRWNLGGIAPFCTTKANVEQHEVEIPWAYLNKTFKDAILLAHLLGLKHVWIDWLCILQDDIEDWSRESKEMHSVYSNATLSVFATSPEGLFFTRRDGAGRKHRHRTYDISDRDARMYSIHAFGGNLQGHWLQYDTLMSHGELFTRGWVFQEWLMCRGAVVFDSREVIWSCDHCDIGECSGATPERWRVVGQMTRAEYRESLRRREQSSRLWQSVVNIFSSSQLTFDEDRLVALSGLAKQWRKDWADAGKMRS